MYIIQCKNTQTHKYTFNRFAPNHVNLSLNVFQKHYKRNAIQAWHNYAKQVPYKIANAIQMAFKWSKDRFQFNLIYVDERESFEIHTN